MNFTHQIGSSVYAPDLPRPTRWQGATICPPLVMVAPLFHNERETPCKQ